VRFRTIDLSYLRLLIGCTPTAIEYGLIAALVVLVVVTGMTATGTSIGDIYNATINIAVVALAG
jgi:Flp pilus assembly pilin Flp